MKIRLVVAIVGLAISFTVPTLAQQKETVDPQIGQQIGALAAKFDEAYNKHDSTAVAAFYAEDAVKVTPHGTFSGRQAIEKDLVINDFQQHQTNDLVLKVNQVNAVGNDVRALGTWSISFQEGSHAGERSHASGHFSWIIVREGDTWQIRRSTVDQSVAD
jgi:uncharacterized protein (TIGR02246 family)